MRIVNTSEAGLLQEVPKWVKCSLKKQWLWRKGKETVCKFQLIVPTLTSLRIPAYTLLKVSSKGLIHCLYQHLRSTSSSTKEATKILFFPSNPNICVPFLLPWLYSCKTSYYWERCQLVRPKENWYQQLAVVRRPDWKSCWPGRSVG